MGFVKKGPAPISPSNVEYDIYKSITRPVCDPTFGVKDRYLIMRSMYNLLDLWKLMQQNS